MSYRFVSFGEVMMRLSPPGYKKMAQAQSLDINYGGGEANVAIALAQLGLSASHVTIFPENSIGHAAKSWLCGKGLDVSGIRMAGERMGLYFLEVGAGARASKVTYDRFDSAFARMEGGAFNWEQILSGASCFHWSGITPALSQAASDELLSALKTAQKLGVMVTADMTYRRNLWRYGKEPKEVMAGLLMYSNVLIGGKSSLLDFLGDELGLVEDRYPAVCRQVMGKLPNVKLCVNTKRDTVSASFNHLSAVGVDRQEVYNTQKLEIFPIVDRIGGGDAFAAGLIYGLTHGFDMDKTLHHALVCSVMKHYQEGDSLLMTSDELAQATAGDLSGKLVR